MEAIRLQKLLVGAGLLAAAGVIYILAVTHLGVGIACPFERLTGYSCPGCGVSGMFFAMLRGDIKAAFASNPLTFTLLPAYLALGIYLCRQYVTYGYLKVSAWINKSLIALICVYILFGIVRNLN